MSEAINKTTATIQEFLNAAEAEIEEKLALGKPIPTTGLAERLAPKFGMEPPQGYHILKIYLVSRPDLKAKKGKSGGIVRAEVKSV